jgi:hypothetical protein
MGRFSFFAFSTACSNVNQLTTASAFLEGALIDDIAVMIRQSKDTKTPLTILFMGIS